MKESVESPETAAVEEDESPPTFGFRLSCRATRCLAIFCPREPLPRCFEAASSEAASLTKAFLQLIPIASPSQDSTLRGARRHRPSRRKIHVGECVSAPPLHSTEWAR